jgi:hypothetical protein
MKIAGMMANGIENPESEYDKRYSNDIEAKDEGIASDCPRWSGSLWLGRRLNSARKRLTLLLTSCNPGSPRLPRNRAEIDYSIDQICISIKKEAVDHVFWGG